MSSKRLRNKALQKSRGFLGARFLRIFYFGQIWALMAAALLFFGGVTLDKIWTLQLPLLSSSASKVGTGLKALSITIVLLAFANWHILFVLRQIKKFYIKLIRPTRVPSQGLDKKIVVVVLAFAVWLPLLILLTKGQKAAVSIAGVEVWLATIFLVTFYQETGGGRRKLREVSFWYPKAVLEDGTIVDHGSRKFRMAFLTEEPHLEPQAKSERAHLLLDLTATFAEARGREGSSVRIILWPDPPYLDPKRLKGTQAFVSSEGKLLRSQRGSRVALTALVYEADQNIEAALKRRLLPLNMGLRRLTEGEVRCYLLSIGNAQTRAFAAMQQRREQPSFLPKHLAFDETVNTGERHITIFQITTEDPNELAAVHRYALKREVDARLHLIAVPIPREESVFGTEGRLVATRMPGVSGRKRVTEELEELKAKEKSITHFEIVLLAEVGGATREECQRKSNQLGTLLDTQGISWKQLKKYDLAQAFTNIQPILPARLLINAENILEPEVIVRLLLGETLGGNTVLSTTLSHLEEKENETGRRKERLVSVISRGAKLHLLEQRGGQLGQVVDEHGNYYPIWLPLLELTGHGLIMGAQEFGKSVLAGFLLLRNLLSADCIGVVFDLRAGMLFWEALAKTFAKKCFIVTPPRFEIDPDITHPGKLYQSVMQSPEATRFRAEVRQIFDKAKPGTIVLLKVKAGQEVSNNPGLTIAVQELYDWMHRTKRVFIGVIDEAHQVTSSKGLRHIGIFMQHTVVTLINALKHSRVGEEGQSKFVFVTHSPYDLKNELGDEVRDRCTNVLWVAADDWTLRSMGYSPHINELIKSVRRVGEFVVILLRYGFVEKCRLVLKGKELEVARVDQKRRGDELPKF